MPAHQGDILLGPFVRCINYYAVNDPILTMVSSTARALRSGFSFGGGSDREIVFCVPIVQDR